MYFNLPMHASRLSIKIMGEFGTARQLMKTYIHIKHQSEWTRHLNCTITWTYLSKLSFRVINVFPSDVGIKERKKKPAEVDSKSDKLMNFQDDY